MKPEAERSTSGSSVRGAVQIAIKNIHPEIIIQMDPSQIRKGDKYSLPETEKTARETAVIATDHELVIAENEKVRK